MNHTNVPAGTECYNVDAAPLVARGIQYSPTELTSALKGRVSAILRDDVATAQLEDVLLGLATTSFQVETLRSLLSFAPNDLPSWRVGEALAEAYLTDHRACNFPWPMGRDLRNPSASPAGTDLVGFHHPSEDVRFAFCEVKTSEEEKWPPGVLTGRHGLSEQLSQLRDSTRVKNYLVRYLGLRAANADWRPTFQAAAARFLVDVKDVSLFGILIRDVQPKPADLLSRAHTLANNCPPTTRIELRAIYLPTSSIQTLPHAATEALGGAS